MGIARVFDPVALQRAQIVGIAQLGSQLFEYGPIALLPLMADLQLQVTFQIRRHPIVVEQGVIDIKQKDDVVHEVPMSAGSPASSQRFPLRVCRSCACPRSRGGLAAVIHWTSIRLLRPPCLPLQHPLLLIPCAFWCSSRLAFLARSLRCLVDESKGRV